MGWISQTRLISSFKFKYFKRLINHYFCQEVMWGNLNPHPLKNHLVNLVSITLVPPLLYHIALHELLSINICWDYVKAKWNCRSLILSEQSHIFLFKKNKKLKNRKLKFSIIYPQSTETVEVNSRYSNNNNL